MYHGITTAVVNVATGHYVKGQERLTGLLRAQGQTYSTWSDTLPNYSPAHSDVPYAFKAWALKAAHCSHGAELLLWCDACIVPRNLELLWEHIARDGYWFSNNGYTNYEWTADSAYPDLFASHYGDNFQPSIEALRNVNRTIPHVVATSFGLDMRSARGQAFLDEYLRLAQTEAFCGPWTNLAHKDAPGSVGFSYRCGFCGPADVRGHRHDQTAASVIAWRLGFKLTDPPDVFAYKGGETDKTILIADGAY